MRFADDTLSIIKKESFDEIFEKLNSWDKKLEFKSEKMTETLKFFDCEIFVRNSKLEFRPYRKQGTSTVISNYT